MASTGDTGGTEDGTGTASSSAMMESADPSTDTAENTNGALPVDVPARGGISIEWVEANQGVGVPIGRDGQGVPGSDRNAYLIQGRGMTLVRAFWKLPEDWKPRTIEARLTLYPPNGEPEVKVHSVYVEKDSFIGNLKSSFYWGLEADRLVPGLKYRIELFETEAGYEEIPEGDTPSSMPYEGTAVVGIEDSYQKMKIVVVPFRYQYGNCSTDLSNISDKAKKVFYDYIFMMNPVDTVEISWHEALEFKQELKSLYQINVFLSDLRAEEGADPEVYYYGVIDPCSPGVDGAAGLAHGIPNPNPPKKTSAYQRVSTGILDSDAARGEDDKWLKINAETFVHEVGHSQGRMHVDGGCGEAGTDGSYPYDTSPGGVIGDWGWGVIDFSLKHKTVHKDYMTYCTPTWVSTYGWNKVYNVIKTLSSWELEDQASGHEEQGMLLIGTVLGNGETMWSTTPGVLEQAPAVDAGEHLELVSGDTIVADLPAEVMAIPDSVHGEYNLVVQLPKQFANLQGIDKIHWTSTATNTFQAVAMSEINAHRKLFKPLDRKAAD